MEDQRLHRVVAFLSSPLIRQCDSLANRYGTSRSEVIRLALAEGIASVKPALARLRKLRTQGLEDQASGRPSLRSRRGGRPRGSVAVPGVTAPEAASPAEELAEYARSVRRLQPEVGSESLRVMLLAQAAILSVAVDDVDDVVDDALDAVSGSDGVEPAPDPTAPPEAGA